MTLNAGFGSEVTIYIGSRSIRILETGAKLKIDVLL